MIGLGCSSSTSAKSQSLDQSNSLEYCFNNC